jgi:hypothetical protein
MGIGGDSIPFYTNLNRRGFNLLQSSLNPFKPNKPRVGKSSGRERRLARILACAAVQPVSFRLRAILLTSPDPTDFARAAGRAWQELRLSALMEPKFLL